MPFNLLTKLEICGFWGPTLVSLTENFEILFAQYRPGGILDVMPNNVAVLCHLIIWRNFFPLANMCYLKQFHSSSDRKHTIKTGLRDPRPRRINHNIQAKFYSNAIGYVTLHG